MDRVGETELFVATNGNDSWSGFLPDPNEAGTDGPLATITGARDAIREMKAKSALERPVIVTIRGGTYRIMEPIEFLPIDTGSKESPITYRADPGEKPVVSGGVRITGWKKTGDVWLADVPLTKGGGWQFRQLWVDGRRAIPARTPDFGEAFWADTAPMEPIGDEGDDPTFPYRHFTYRGNDLDSLEEGSDAIIVMFHSFTSTLHHIEKIDKERKRVSLFNPGRKVMAGAGRRYYVCFHKDSLDAPGEWYLDVSEGKLYYFPRPGENLNDAEAIAPITENIVRLRGDASTGKVVEHLRFEGISFEHTDWTMNKTAMMDGQAAVDDPLRRTWLRGTTYYYRSREERGRHPDEWLIEPVVTPEDQIDPSGDPAKGSLLSTAAIHATGSLNCDFVRCEIAHTGGYGLWFGDGSKENRAEQCEIHDLGAGGVMLGETCLPFYEHLQAEKNRIFNSFIHDGGHVFHSGVGVWIGKSSYNTVDHNEISDFYYSGISIGWSWGYTPSEAHHNGIEFNHIHHLAWNVLTDLGGIYTLGRAPGTRIRHNVIHHISSVLRRGRGIYLDQATTDYLIENNLVYRVNDGAFHLHFGYDNLVRNNIFADASEYAVITCASGEDHHCYSLAGNIICTRGNVPFLDKTVRDDRVLLKNNLYWNVTNDDTEGTLEALKEGHAEEKKRHRDDGSIVADPLFINADGGDFRLQEESPAIRDLGFVPFEPSEAGLTGSAEWVAMPDTINRPEMDFYPDTHPEPNDYERLRKASFSP